MTLVERLGELERTLGLAGIPKDAATVRAAIARIEAADECFAYSGISEPDTSASKQHCGCPTCAYRALVREQDKEAPHA